MKSADFETPCGFRITLVLTDRQELITKAAFNGELVSFVNSGFCLSQDGALMLAGKIKELYADA